MTNPTQNPPVVPGAASTGPAQTQPATSNLNVPTAPPASAIDPMSPLSDAKYRNQIRQEIQQGFLGPDQDLTPEHMDRLAKQYPATAAAVAGASHVPPPSARERNVDTVLKEEQGMSLRDAWVKLQGRYLANTYGRALNLGPTKSSTGLLIDDLLAVEKSYNANIKGKETTEINRALNDEFIRRHGASIKDKLSEGVKQLKDEITKEVKEDFFPPESNFTFDHYQKVKAKYEKILQNSPEHKAEVERALKRNHNGVTLESALQSLALGVTARDYGKVLLPEKFVPGATVDQEQFLKVRNHWRTISGSNADYAGRLNDVFKGHYGVDIEARVQEIQKRYKTDLDNRTLQEDQKRELEKSRKK